MDKFKKVNINLNPDEQKVVELVGQIDKLEEVKSSITDEKELGKIQEKIDDLNKERMELIGSSDKKEEVTEQEPKKEVEETSTETDEEKLKKLNEEIRLGLENSNNKNKEEGTNNKNELDVKWDGEIGYINIKNEYIEIHRKTRWFKKIYVVEVVGTGEFSKKYPKRSEFKTQKEAIDEARRIRDEYLKDEEEKRTREQEERTKEQEKNKLKEEEEIQQDRKNKPFSYFALEKVNNKILLDYYLNKETKKLDLRSIEKDWQEISWKFLHAIDEKEGFFEFNIFGFVKIIKNVEELRSDEGIASYSEKAIYKIMGPNNEIIADDIQGYDEATRIYNEETNKQRMLIEQEFEKMLRVREENSQTSQGGDNKQGDEDNKASDEVPGVNNTEGQQTEENSQEEKNKSGNENIETNNEEKGEETIPVIEITKLEDLLANKEFEMNSRLEKSKFKNSIIKGLDKWENFGQGEEGKKGFVKRMTKNAINLALIGLISSLSVEKLAEAGIGSATALGGGTFTYVGRKMAIGLGFATAFDRVGNKLSGNKNYGKIKKALPWMVGIGSVTAATLMSGGLVGAAAGAGFLASKLYKGRYTNEKIAAREEKAKIKFFEKIKGQELDLDQLKKIEKDYESLLKHYQRTRIWGKIADTAAKLSIGTIISTMTLEASGMAKDAIANMQTQNENPDTNIKTIEKETTTKTPDDLNKNTVPTHQADTTLVKSDTLNSTVLDSTHSDTTTTTEQPITNPETHTEMKEMNVEFSSRGAIATIDNLKDQIKSEYPDISKAPESVREFMETDSTKMAIKLGFYNPDSPDESAMVIKGSTLSFNQEGDLVMHDVKTGEDHTFLEGTHDETVDKYEGKMFDSDHSAEKIETSTTTDVSESGHQGEGVTGTEGSSHVSEAADKTETTNQEQGADNKEVTTDKQTTGEKEAIIEHRALTTEELEQVKTTYNNNLDKLMDKSPESRWEYIQKNVTAERFMELADKGEIKSDFNSLADHMNKLEEVTGVRPEGAQYIGGLLVKEAESIPNYIGRALEEALRKGVLDKVTL